MSGAFPDPWCLMGSGQTKACPLQGSWPAIPSQMIADRWFAPPVHPPDVWFPASPARIIPSDSDNWAPPLGLEPEAFPLPTLSQNFPCEEKEYAYGTGSGGHDTSFYSTHEQITSLFHTIDPRLLVNYISTVPATPDPTLGQPQAHFVKSPPSRGPPGSISTNDAGDALQFLKMDSNSRYECLRDDGSGKICGYVGTSRQVKQHLRSDHRSNRYVLDS